MSVLTVDIFVSYYHHPITLLLDTLRAVVSIDYPSDSFRVILLDSSNSQEIKDHVQGLGIDNVYYTAQEVPSQTLSKTTKLTHGLQFVESLPGGTSQLMAVLDVGAIPSPLWLRELIPFILEDETVAMASTPKHPYDIPDGDPLRQNTESASSSMLAMQDSLGTSPSTSSGWIARRSAIETIVGVLTDKFVQEDAWMSVLLNAHGWKTIFIPKVLQHGLAEHRLGARVANPKSKHAGLWSIIKLLADPSTPSMTLSQRVGVLSGPLSDSLTNVATSLCVIAMPCLLLSGKPLIIYAKPAQLSSLLRFSFLHFLATWLYGYVDVAAVRGHKPIWPPQNPLYLAPYRVMRLFGFAGTDIRARDVPEAAEREKTAPPPSTPAQVLWTALLDGGAAVLLPSIAAGLVGIYSSVNTSLEFTEGSVSYFRTLGTQLAIRAAWPPALLIWAAMVSSCWTPIGNAIFALPAKDREEWLFRNPTSKVAYPIDSIDIWRSFARLQVSQKFSMFALLYFTVAFLFSWA
ncbi:MAG: hypothetical protein L6R42_002066 [Xanthoria sp. 1 TBL-2021]|nr:MAG: hypothetical protein L6R42_002066 [Xanthoria sp. 1 TBL-2021]